MRLRIHPSERVQTLIVGGGQAGLAVGYHLARRDLPFLILDANERIGDSWRRRWDSLRLFTPARYNALPGMAFPGPARVFSTKDEVADYLATYAARFELPHSDRHPCRPAVEKRHRLHGRGGGQALRGGQRRCSDGKRPGPPDARIRRSARSRHRPAPLQRVPEPRGAPRRVGARRRSRKLRRRDCHRSRQATPHRARGQGEPVTSPFASSARPRSLSSCRCCSGSSATGW